MRLHDHQLRRSAKGGMEPGSGLDRAISCEVGRSEAVLTKRNLRFALLALMIVFAGFSIPHWDVEAVATNGPTTTHFRDLSSGQIYPEGTLDLLTLGFTVSALATVILYATHWVRMKRFAV